MRKRKKYDVFLLLRRRRRETNLCYDLRTDDFPKIKDKKQIFSESISSKKELKLEKELRDTLGDSDDYTILAGSKNNK